MNRVGNYPLSGCAGVLLLACWLISPALAGQSPGNLGPAPASTTFPVRSTTDPSDGIILIEPPSPGPLGTAATSFPLRLPPGRAGVEPRLSLDYHHELENGWLGQGWDLSLPAITLDTRWGVPRYAADYESESYLLNGEQLSPAAHRDGNLPRQADRQFYERVEGAFSRIYRHGAATDAYWWEVQHGDGSVDFYGGLPGTGLVAGAVLRSPEGHIARWALTATVDVYGNRIDYHYRVQADPGRPTSTESGYALYPDYLTYTGHDEREGPFRVDFIRDRELDEPRRPDVEIEGIYGFKTVTADLLRRIVVSYAGATVRMFELTYRTGLYRRSLLASVAELDPDGTEFYRHDFDYFDAVNVDGRLRPFGPEENWNTGRDDLEGPLLNPLPGFPNEGSSLGTSTSGSIQFGTAVTFGPAGSVVTKDFTVGGTIGFGQNEAEGLIALVDINGDVLPDKVFRQDDAIRYRRNLGDGTFGEVRTIAGISSFSFTKTSENSYGAEANVAPLFAGYEYTTATSTTSTYFTDFNGDDLIDIVERGKVLFNHLDERGDPVFTPSSNDTPNPIVAGAPPDPGLISVDPAEQEARIDQSPLHDVVRCWQAPWDGIVTIDAPVSLRDPGDYGRADGVRVSIQQSGTVRFARRIQAGDAAVYRPTGVSNLRVSRGERIYFRVQSVFDGAFDVVDWDPEIYYVERDTSLRDPNGKAYFRYRASEDFLLASSQTVRMPESGPIDIAGEFSKPRTTDTVFAEIVRTRRNASTILVSDTFPADSAINGFSIGLTDLAVDTSVDLQFRIRAASSVDWTALTWAPTIRFQSGGYVYCPALDVTLFSEAVLPGKSFTVPDSGAYYLEVSLLQGVPRPTTERLEVSVKSRDTLHGRFATTLTGSTYRAEGYVGLPADRELFVEVFDPNSFATVSLRASLQDSTGRARGAGAKQTLEAGLYRILPTTELIFGNGYRGWGQFVYNGNRGRASLPIQESLLKRTEIEVDSSDLEGIEDIDPEEPGAFDRFTDLGGDPATEPFVVMVADAKAGNWRGYDNLTRVGPGYLSSSRLGEDDILLTPDLGDGGGTAPGLISKYRIHAVAGGVSAGIAGLGASYADNATESILDLIDMNGDRYPDLVSPTRIQYTGPFGGLDGSSLRHEFGSHAAVSRATGLTAGGGFVNSSPSNAGSASGKGSRRKARRTRARARNNGERAQSSNESGESAASISGNFTEDLDYAAHSWQDMNGDGLPDKVWRNGDVALNYGYRFGPVENWGFTEIASGVSYDYGGGVGVNISNGSIMAGVGVSRTDNWTREWLQDINGDGLTDRLRYSDAAATLTANLNHGTGFGPDRIWEADAPRPEEGNATSENVNGAFTICVNILLVRVCFNPGTSAGRGVSRTLTQYIDVDGDGVPESVRAGEDDSRLIVRRSTLGKSNLLHRIRGPLGGTIALDYARTPLTHEMPLPKWVLSKVAVNDGVSGDGPEWRRAAFAYESPVYDRRERDFYGYRKVREIHLDTEHDDRPYRELVKEYYQRNYYDKGLLSAEYVTDAEGNRFGTKEYEYTLYQPQTMEVLATDPALAPGGRVFPALTAYRNTYQEGDASDGVSEYETFRYNEFGEIAYTSNSGNGRPEDFLEVFYDYHEMTDPYRTDAILRQETFGGGQLLRSRRNRINGQGDPLQVISKIDATTEATVDYAYDVYGNVTVETDPITEAGERHRHAFAYDGEVHTYLVARTDGYGYQSAATFDPRFGTMTSLTDIQGQTVRIGLDLRGRTTSVHRPRDPEYSYRFHHFPDAPVPYGLTERYDPSSGEALRFYDFVDGFGRQIQRKQPSVIASGERPQLVVSGRVLYDAFDREAYTYYPTVESLGEGPTYSVAPAPEPPARIAYDVLDRGRQMTEPNGVVSAVAYAIAPIPDGERMLRRILTDGRGNRTATFTTASGQLEALWTEDLGQRSWTLQRYNPLGDLVTVADPTGCRTTYTYDLLGRMIRENPCDAGTTDYYLDPAGLLTAKVTPNLRALNPDDPPRIRYAYELDRVVRIDYPKNYQNRVELTYGGPAAPHHRVGRLSVRLDASGGEEYFYDADGNVTKTIRTLLINEGAVRTYVSESEYDSWGRLRRIVYPDGEAVTYRFSADGRPVGLTGSRDGVDYRYLDGVEYDRFGEVTTQVFGNGIRQAYRFDPTSRRLSGFGIGDLLATDYSLDAAGNPETINYGGSLGTGSERFAYDDHHQLIEAVGSWETGGLTADYDYFVDYDTAYNPLRQQLRFFDGADTIRRTLEYTYTPTAAHQPAEVSGRTYSFDDNGNLLGYTGERGSFHYVQYRWDEENRLMAVSRQGVTTQYTYDAAGRRAIESNARLSGVFTNGAPSGGIDHGGDYRAYVSPFFTATKDGFTKHYWWGDQRIASKEGTGEFNNYYWHRRGLTAGSHNYADRMQELTATVWNYYGELGVPPGPPTLPGFYAQPEITGTGLPAGPPTATAGSPPGWPGQIPAGDPGQPPGPPTQLPPTVARDSVRAGYGFTSYAAFPESSVQFYHPDPMGNVRLITNELGEVTQQNAYLPTGEKYADVSDQAQNTYGFNGMPTTSDGGLYYFGARFLDSETGAFLSRDPNAADYPGHNPYAFGLNNPLAFNDPDGRDPIKLFSSPQEAAYEFSRVYNKRSFAENVEFGARIYRMTIAGKGAYFYEPDVTMGGHSGLSFPDKQYGNNLVGDVHTHGMMVEAGRGRHGYVDFSGTDRRAYRKEADKLKKPYLGFMANPKGELREYVARPGDYRRRVRRSAKILRRDLDYDADYFNGGSPDAKRVPIGPYFEGQRVQEARKTKAKRKASARKHGPRRGADPIIDMRRPRKNGTGRRGPGRRKHRR